MRVDLSKQTFVDLSPDELWSLKEGIEDLVIKGIISEKLRNYFFEPWREALGYDDRQGLLLMSTAFPQRMLLSIIYQQEQWALALEKNID